MATAHRFRAIYFWMAGNQEAAPHDYPCVDDETRLALAAGQGDRGAAAAFVRATQQQVWRFVAHLAGPGEADDLTQETYVRALRGLPRFAARSSALTWLLVIARRVVVDHHRTAAARPRTAALDDWPAAADARVFPVEDGVVLRRLLDGLRPERREALVATQVLGLSYEEAARVCDCPVGTIRSRVARARDDMIAAMTAVPHADQGAGGRVAPRTPWSTAR